MNIAELFVKTLDERKLSVSSAESCTGGLIGKMITDVPGASSIYPGGFITYSNEMKIKHLSVKKETIDKYTEVSRETASEMALGARNGYNTDIGISTTGFAGPAGGNENDPVGSVYIAVSCSDRITAERFFAGEGLSRDAIRKKSAKRALSLALHSIKETENFEVTIGNITENEKDEILDILTDPCVKKTYMIPDYEDRKKYEELFGRFENLSLSGEKYVKCVFVSGVPVGFINEVSSENGKIELGWAEDPAFHNMGFMTKGVRKAIEELFGSGYNEIIAGAFSENPASARVMEKNFMKKTKQKEKIEYRGRLHDCVYYSLERSDFFGRIK